MVIARLLFILWLVAKYTSSLECTTVSHVCAQNSDTTCEACLHSHPCCTWCLEENFTQKRCNTREALIELKCNDTNIYSGGNSKIEEEEKKDAAFKDPDENKNQPAVQIRPQELSMQLRLNDPVTFQLRYKAAVDYPLDLYYLMDLTYSMKDDVQTMINLGSGMTDFLKTLTKTYKIGLGYFMDKVAMPFSFNNKELLDNPCQKNGLTCEKGYDFIHALNFTQKVNEFVQKLNSSKITANLDDLEGGGDAIMQIIVCKDHMQWRTFSRKLIVIATDGFFHFSGDGILAGIPKKNPGICMIDSDASYAAALRYDYPSLEEIYRKLLQYKVNLLFAAKQEVYAYYDQFHSTIPTVTYIGQLEEKSKNIFSLIEKSYKEVVSNVHFEAKAPDGVKVTFKSTCNKREMQDNTNSCDNIKIGDVYTFNVTIELEKIPTNMKDTIIIEEMNLAEDVKINVEYVGIQCNCRNENKDILCNHGIFHCGKCNCEEGWAGENCEIECLTNPCRFTNETYISSTCYSHGDCDRNTCTCICDSEYTGTYCEHPQCKRNPRTRAICSDHGTCDKGICNCYDNYEGDDCSCYQGIENCIVPGKEICNGVGTCKCGKCECPPEYAGERCEYCPSCEKICESYDSCIISVAQNKSDYDCSSNDTKYITQRVEQIESKCLARYLNKNEVLCEIEYSYFVTGDKIKLQYLDPYCATPFYASTPAISAFVLIVVGGIVGLLVWKLHTMRKDKMQYKKFEQDVSRSRFSNQENPIYRSPVRKYFNPLTTNGEMFETDMKLD